MENLCKLVCETENGKLTECGIFPSLSIALDVIEQKWKEKPNPKVERYTIEELDSSSNSGKTWLVSSDGLIIQRATT